MPYSKPLSYPTTQSVIKNLNAGIRIELSRTCRSIRLFEKRLPLKINHLHLEPYSITIDDVRFTMDVVKCSKSQEHQSVTSTYPSIEMSPGDIFIESPVRPGTMIGSTDYAQWRMKLIKLESQNDYEKNQGEIDNLRDVLLPYDLIRVGTENFSYGIRLTVKRFEKTFWQEKMAYNDKFHLAMKYLMTKILMGRSDMVQVNQLNINPRLENCCFRTPSGLKMRVQKLIITKNTLTVLDAFALVIDESSYPFKQIEIARGENSRRQYNHPVIQTAEKLVITGTVYSEDIIALTHPRVHFNQVRSLYHEFFEEFRIRFSVGPRAIGSHFSFSLQNRMIAGTLLQMFESQESVVVPSNTMFGKTIVHKFWDGTTELIIYCKQDGAKRGKHEKFPTIHFKLQSQN